VGSFVMNDPTWVPFLTPPQIQAPHTITTPSEPAHFEPAASFATHSFPDLGLQDVPSSHATQATTPSTRAHAWRQLQSHYLLSLYHSSLSYPILTPSLSDMPSTTSERKEAVMESSPRKVEKLLLCLQVIPTAQLDLALPGYPEVLPYRSPSLNLFDFVRYAAPITVERTPLRLVDEPSIRGLIPHILRMALGKVGGMSTDQRQVILSALATAAVSNRSDSASFATSERESTPLIETHTKSSTGEDIDDSDAHELTQRLEDLLDSHMSTTVPDVPPWYQD